MHFLSGWKGMIITAGMLCIVFASVEERIFSLPYTDNPLQRLRP